MLLNEDKRLVVAVTGTFRGLPLYQPVTRKVTAPRVRPDAFEQEPCNPDQHAPKRNSGVRELALK